MRLLFALGMVLLLSVAVVISCGGSEGEIKDGVPFTIQVSPKNTEGHALGEFKFSVTANSEEARKAINISASMSGAEIKSIEPSALMPGEVTTIIVTPFASTTGQTLTLSIEGERDGIVETTTAEMFIGTES